MLSDTHYMERIDQECLKALDALSAISDHRLKHNTIYPDQFGAVTTAGMEQEHYQALGLDIEVVYQQEVEYGSKALLYSFTDRLLCVVYYHDITDRYNYRGFTRDQVRKAVSYYAQIT